MIFYNRWIVTLNYKILNNLLIFDRNTKISYNCVQTNDYH